MSENPRIIVFTDLDGTLLDFITYSFQKALPVIKELKKKKIPIIFCTNKTRAENEYYQKKLKIADPFIVENGGAIFIPKNYFSFSFPYQKSKSNYKVIELGIPYSKIRKKIKKVREKLNCIIAGFGDLSPKSIAKITGLNLAKTRLARQRDYNEPFIAGIGAEEKIMKELKKEKLQVQFGGRFYNASSRKSNKGKAIKILSSLFKKEFGKIKTIGLGDSQNDLFMFKAVDFPVLVQKPSGKWSPEIRLKKIIKIKEVGPQGWVKAIKKYAL
jgi:mannosyl-3-phosphoglycerate phosphatase